VFIIAPFIEPNTGAASGTVLNPESVQPCTPFVCPLLQDVVFHAFDKGWEF
jgi:hypothetical protein